MHFDDFEPVKIGTTGQRHSLGIILLRINNIANVQTIFLGKKLFLSSLSLK